MKKILHTGSKPAAAACYIGLFVLWIVLFAVAYTLLYRFAGEAFSKPLRVFALMVWLVSGIYVYPWWVGRHTTWLTVLNGKKQEKQHLKTNKTETDG